MNKIKEIKITTSNKPYSNKKIKDDRKQTQKAKGR